MKLPLVVLVCLTVVVLASTSAVEPQQNGDNTWDYMLLVLEYDYPIADCW